MLGLYQQIVQQGELAADDSVEQLELRLTGLAVRRDGKLRVYNRIYEQVFNRTWLERSLAELRPYGVAIAAWLESKHQDESRLLRGQALQDARIWAEGKSLGDDDRRFLDASQELAKRDIQRALVVEAAAKQVLAEANQKAELALTEERAANQRLTLAQQETEEIIRRGQRTRAMTSAVAAVAIAAAVGAFLLAETQFSAAEKARTEAEKAKTDAQQKTQTAIDAQQQFKVAQANLGHVTRQMRDVTVKGNAAEHKATVAVAKQQAAARQAQAAEHQRRVAITQLGIATQATQQARQTLIAVQQDATHTKQRCGWPTES